MSLARASSVTGSPARDDALAGAHPYLTGSTLARSCSRRAVVSEESGTMVG